VTARPGLPSFEYVRPDNFHEAVHLLLEHEGAARLMMGGTDLLVRMRDGALCPRLLIDVKGLDGMQDVIYSPLQGLGVGAAVTMNQLARHPVVQAHYPLLAEAANSVASFQLRNRATVGGNLCNASPCADMAPATLAMEGRFALRQPHDERTVPAASFFLGPGQSVLHGDEMMIAIEYPVPPPGSIGRYLKLGRNKVGDLALVSVAVLGYPDEAAPSGYGFRIALGAVAPVPLRVPEAEASLAQKLDGEASLRQAARLAVEAASPIDDVRASAAYRSAMVHNLTLRGLREVWQQLSAGQGGAA
jgi:CO/xanthine dehydrogenase FAD-binding subunit